jgi:hypothetical protein
MSDFAKYCRFSDLIRLASVANACFVPRFSSPPKLVGIFMYSDTAGIPWSTSRMLLWTIRSLTEAITMGRAVFPGRLSGTL